MARYSLFDTVVERRYRIQKALSFISTNANTQIDLNKLCDVSNYSSYHFQRLFTQFSGETWCENLARNRLFAAAQKLLNSNDTICNLSLASGFDTQVGFNKAFKRYFALSPSAYRKEKSGTHFIPIIPAKNIRRTNITPLCIRLLEEQEILCTKSMGCVAGRFDSAGWMAFSKLICKLHTKDLLKYGEKWMGIVPSFSEFYKTDDASYYAGVQLKNQEAVAQFKNEIESYRVPRGHYAIFEHTGPLNEQTMNAAIFDWLPTSGYSISNVRPLLFYFSTTNIGSYAEKFIHQEANNEHAYRRLGVTMQTMENAVIKIYIPIESTVETKTIQISNKVE